MFGRATIRLGIGPHSSCIMEHLTLLLLIEAAKISLNPPRAANRLATPLPIDEAIRRLQVRRRRLGVYVCVCVAYVISTTCHSAIAK